MRIGVYGGSFDPPHVAHVLLATYALSVGRFDRILVVPVFSHAFHKSLAPFEHRVRMCELAFAEMPRVSVSRVESGLPIPSRTIATLEQVAGEYPHATLRLVIGADVLAESSKWHAFDEVVRMAPPFVVGRSGHDEGGEARFALPAVSSTRIRELCSRRVSNHARAELAELVPSAVLDYIEAHGLYARLESTRPPDESFS